MRSSGPAFCDRRGHAVLRKASLAGTVTFEAGLRPAPARVARGGAGEAVVAQTHSGGFSRHLD